MTDNLQKLLYDHDALMMTSSHREIAREMKEKLSFVSLDYKNDMEFDINFEKEYVLPDKSIIRVSRERFKCTESLFYPNLIGINDIDGIHTLIDDSINQAHKDMRSMLFKNIVLTGGNTLFPGLQKRLSHELDTIVSEKYNNNNNSNSHVLSNSMNMKTHTHKNGMNLYDRNITLSRTKGNRHSKHKNIHVHIRATPERKYGAWIGGSVIASLESLSGMWVSNDDYKEHGADVVHRRVLSAV